MASVTSACDPKIRQNKPVIKEEDVVFHSVVIGRAQTKCRAYRGRTTDFLRVKTKKVSGDCEKKQRGGKIGQQWTTIEYVRIILKAVSVILSVKIMSCKLKK